ncbi:SpoIIE family protein phosphatase [Nocardioides sp. SYSU DS0663]|uniref:SpoIIE family protein phosphatase n=1 Tax=Nocardioides sp. SYSU DS0663 TaxID=3416445 RepID=UPI003F4B7C16
MAHVAGTGRHGAGLALGGAVALLVVLLGIGAVSEVQLAAVYASAVVASTSADPRPTAVIGGLADHAPPLGLGGEPTVGHGHLGVGDRLLLFTDGLVETRGPDGGFVDLAEILRPVRGPSLEDALEGVLARLRQLAACKLDDDLALLLVERRA